MKIKYLTQAVAIALTLSATQAMAQDFQWDEHDALEIEFPDVTIPGAFTDYFYFSLSNPVNIDSITVASNNGAALQIDQGTVTLYQFSGNILGASLGSYSFDGTTGSTNHFFDNVAAGTYAYVVTGFASGTDGGSYTISSTISAVPEPSAWALMIAGLGMIGFISHRRRQYF